MRLPTIKLPWPYVWAFLGWGVAFYYASLIAGVEIILLGLVLITGWAAFLMFHMLLTERKHHFERRQDWERETARIEQAGDMERIQHADDVRVIMEAFGKRERVPQLRLKDGTDA